MDDSCAVCAEALEWVAYGACGHREVCSNCIIRLRFICNDRCCCICKSESSIIFVTKALGDYTCMINDFSTFPANPIEGQVGQYWFHEDAQAFFDDMDHYKMLKAMCKLSCNICDRKNEQRNGGPKGTGDFNSIEQLKIHLFHQHRLFMCSLCLEGRKIHFRQEHFLCEDAACLEKKFIVFATESEMKRHDTMEHRGCMSRSKRNAVLQIPTSFRYQRSVEQDRRGRGHGKRFNSSDIQLSMAIQDSVETFNAVRFYDISSNTQTISSRRETSNMESTDPFELLATTNSSPSSGQGQVLGQKSASTLLEESSFPPLPMAPSSSRRRSRNVFGSNANTMAARLRHRNAVKVLCSSRALPAASNHPNTSASISYQSRPVYDSGPLSSSSSPNVSQNKLLTNDNPPSSHASSIQSRSSKANDLVSSVNLASSSRTSSSTRKVGHSSSVPNLVKRETIDKIISDSQIDKATISKYPPLKVEDVQSASKVLVEKILAALDFDEDKFAAFKVISVEYRQDLIDTAEYLVYVHQFGLAHLVFELAVLCPNAQKQRELIEIHQYNTRRNGSSENGLSMDNGQPKSKKSTKKGKEKWEDSGVCCSENALAGSLSSGIMKLQINHVQEGVLSEDMSHSAKGKSKIAVDEQANLNLSREPRNVNDAQSANGGSIQNVGPEGGGNKPRKKGSKFLKNRLGEASATALPENSSLDMGVDENEGKTYRKKHLPEILPVHGVWRNGGGRRLVVMTQRECKR
ncbi:E3 ubiquitin-protein ligase HEL2 isoform X2 [Ricinus communis]|uniref:E3 ubiquitin-protein ligase HEL2 isoform X2 n=1 Tax=Ricinus communis TaxID=3988 RepID=UPI00201A7987|nr:E3 ubiquitin-protein ligase HEL2 isoform X2 [Ricinus communis]